MHEPAIDKQQLPPRDLAWPFWFVLPLYPHGRRQTLRQEIQKDTLWTFDQLLGLLYVVVPIRMTVVKLSGGGLLVYAPIAPTGECIRLVRELEAQYGQVKYIILPTTSGLEHKVFVGPFARFFPKADVFVAPDQWSFPIHLPLSWLGLPIGRTHILPKESRKAPFADDFDYAILERIYLGLGSFSEVAFYHKASNSLLVTDIVLSVPEEPPEIVQLDPYPLLFHAKDHALSPIEDTAKNRQKGWQRIVLFMFFFQPSRLDVSTLRQSFQEARKARNASPTPYFGLFPFNWRPDWQSSFATLSNNQALRVAPILQLLILNRAPQETRNWVDKISRWNFKQIIPCHFDAPIQAGSEQFRQAFAFLEEGHPRDYCEHDLHLLHKIDRILTRLRLIPASKIKR
ncbi:MAG: DUF4336 domain-containing protein [Anaerolineae bacterium]|nr:DUF4336 domain-containing protein [Gloeobacterales cyanobacterium ES-bin-313]